MAYNDVLPTRLRMERARTNETQKQVAERAGISAPSLCTYEQGTRTPTMQTLRKLAEAYGVSLDYLAGFNTDAE